MVEKSLYEVCSLRDGIDPKALAQRAHVTSCDFIYCTVIMLERQGSVQIINYFFN